MDAERIVDADLAGATPEEILLMRHMLGADSRNPGFRNYGAWDMNDRRIHRMIEKGLVRQVSERDGYLWTVVTQEWRKALGIEDKSGR